ncbi:hypothetical protein JNUCC0626_33090 [Lentzea sp. JNUCC 0626]
MSRKTTFFADVVQTGTALDANLGPDVAATIMGANRDGRGL